MSRCWQYVGKQDKCSAPANPPTQPIPHRTTPHRSRPHLSTTVAQICEELTVRLQVQVSVGL